MDDNANIKNIFPGKDWQLNACVNYMPMDYVYIDGWRLSGQILIDHLRQTKLDQDALLYPIIFSYRQAIELLIKRIIKDYERINDKKVTIQISHNIVGLFKKYKQIFIDYGGAIKVNKCLKILEKISLLDPNSESSRYSTDTIGNPSIKIPDHIINIESFCMDAEKVLVFLEEINSLLADELVEY